jgi:hypothetical protein
MMHKNYCIFHKIDMWGAGRLSHSPPPPGMELLQAPAPETIVETEALSE